MKVSKAKRKNRRYQVRISGFHLKFDEQLMLQKGIVRILKKIPQDSKIEFKISKKIFYEAQIFIKGSMFGCKFNSSSGNLKKLLSIIFEFTEDEIDTWKNSPGYNDEFAPYFGGYPSYYKEVNI